MLRRAHDEIIGVQRKTGGLRKSTGYEAGHTFLVLLWCGVGTRCTLGAHVNAYCCTTISYPR